MTNRSPHVSSAARAILDQANAAMGTAVAAVHSMAHDHDQLTYGTPTGLIAHFARQVGLQLINGQLTICPHVSTHAPQIMGWAAGHPDNLLCLPCYELQGMADAGTDEDRRCDKCGELCQPIYPFLATLPPTVAQVAGGRAFGLGPIIATFGCCGNCREQYGHGSAAA